MQTICNACRQRTARGFGYTRPGNPASPVYHACSMACLDAIHRNRGSVMIDPDEHETKALDYASEMGGEYVESLGKANLADFTGEEWATLIECIVTNYGDKLRELLSNDDNRD